MLAARRTEKDTEAGRSKEARSNEEAKNCKERKRRDEERQGEARRLRKPEGSYRSRKGASRGSVQCLISG
eukprot:888461-Rhodomonas_salina.1